MTLSSRERVMAMAVGAVVFLLLNLFLLKAFAARNESLHAGLRQQQLAWGAMQKLLEQSQLWAQRDAALSKIQPKLVNENAAGVELLDTIHGVAKAHSVTVENEVFGGVENEQWYRSVPVTLDTHSSWADLIAFLYALQGPEKFIVCEGSNLQVDPADQTKMVGHLKIARWYAP